MATHALPASHIIDDEDAPAAADAPSRVSLLRRVYDAVLNRRCAARSARSTACSGPARCNARCAPSFRRGADFT